MNEFQEAIIDLRDFSFNSTQQDACNVLQILVDKITPMKIRSVKTISKCCTKAIYLSNYCPNCGQKLDWEEENNV